MGWNFGIFGEKIIRHERIHTAQMKELLWLPFYILYGIEYLFRLFQTRHWHRAYLAISFEREAYANDSNPEYLPHRRHFASFRYL